MAIHYLFTHISTLMHIHKASQDGLKERKIVVFHEYYVRFTTFWISIVHGRSGKQEIIHFVEIGWIPSVFIGNYISILLWCET